MHTVHKSLVKTKFFKALKGVSREIRMLGSHNIKGSRNELLALCSRELSHLYLLRGISICHADYVLLLFIVHRLLQSLSSFPFCIRNSSVSPKAQSVLPCPTVAMHRRHISRSKCNTLCTWEVAFSKDVCAAFHLLFSAPKKKGFASIVLKSTGIK